MLLPMNRDYQWPESAFKKNFIKIADDNVSLEYIEKYFSELINAQAYLFPSARSALSAILKFKNINRSHTLFAPKWSSHCVWDILARYGNPCSIYWCKNGAIYLFCFVYEWTIFIGYRKYST